MKILFEISGLHNDHQVGLDLALQIAKWLNADEVVEVKQVEQMRL